MPSHVLLSLAKAAADALTKYGSSAPQSQAAVRAWQQVHGGLKVDGVYGPDSARELGKDLAPVAAPQAYVTAPGGSSWSNLPPDPIKRPSQSVAIATMSAALRQAGKDLGHPIDDTLLQLMLGQKLGAEGAMPGLWNGPGYTLRGTNNSGAAQVLGGAAGQAFAAAHAAIQGWGAFAHKDSNPGGDEYIGWYFIAPTVYDAAKHWLTGYGGTKNVLVQNPRTPEEYARIMKNSGYYTGLTTDTEAEIAKYAGAIRRGMPSIATMNGPANDIHALSVDPAMFDSLAQRKVTENLYDKAKSGRTGSAWSFLLPSTWEDMVKSNGVVWFGPPVLGSLVRGAERFEKKLGFWGGLLYLLGFGLVGVGAYKVMTKEEEKK